MEIKCYFDQNVSLILSSLFFGPILSILPLTDPHCFTHGPFIYDAHSDVIFSIQHVTLNHSNFLLLFCTKFGFVPPLISTLAATKIYKEKKEKMFVM